MPKPKRIFGTCVALEGCTRDAVYSDRLCAKHWQRFRRLGTTLLPTAPTAEERFWKFVNKHGGYADFTDPLVRITEADGECWGWLGYIHKDGYGHFWADGRNPTAHIFSYALHFGKMPEGMIHDHLCRNTVCSRPNHLEAVTPAENMRRGLRHNKTGASV